MMIGGCRRNIERIVPAMLTLALAGCGGASGVRDVDYDDVRAMSGMYSAYMRAHRNRPPPDEQAFREFLNTQKETLEQFGLTVDEMFVSPRNGEPFHWVYGSVLPSSPSGLMNYVGYETAPTDGKRLVIATRGMYEELNESQFRAVFPDAL